LLTRFRSGKGSLEQFDTFTIPPKEAQAAGRIHPPEMCDTAGAAVNPGSAADQ